MNLSWGVPIDTGGSGLAGYEIFRNNGASPIDTSPVASYSDTTATDGTNFTYKVRAYDGAGNRSGFSSQISVTTPDTVPPTAPGIPSFTATFSPRQPHPGPTPQITSESRATNIG